MPGMGLAMKLFKKAEASSSTGASAGLNGELGNSTEEVHSERALSVVVLVRGVGALGECYLTESRTKLGAAVTLQRAMRRQATHRWVCQCEATAQAVGSDLHLTFSCDLLGQSHEATCPTCMNILAEYGAYERSYVMRFATDIEESWRRFVPNFNITRIVKLLIGIEPNPGPFHVTLWDTHLDTVYQFIYHNTSDQLRYWATHEYENVVFMSIDDLMWEYYHNYEDRTEHLTIIAYYLVGVELNPGPCHFILKIILWVFIFMFVLPFVLGFIYGLLVNTYAIANQGGKPLNSSDIAELNTLIINSRMYMWEAGNMSLCCGHFITGLGSDHAKWSQVQHDWKNYVANLEEMGLIKDYREIYELLVGVNNYLRMRLSPHCRSELEPWAMQLPEFKPRLVGIELNPGPNQEFTTLQLEQNYTSASRKFRLLIGIAFSYILFANLMVRLDIVGLEAFYSAGQVNLSLRWVFGELDQVIWHCNGTELLNLVAFFSGVLIRAAVCYLIKMWILQYIYRWSLLVNLFYVYELFSTLGSLVVFCFAAYYENQGSFWILMLCRIGMSVYMQDLLRLTAGTHQHYRTFWLNMLTCLFDAYIGLHQYRLSVNFCKWKQDRDWSLLRCDLNTMSCMLVKVKTILVGVELNPGPPRGNFVTYKPVYDKPKPTAAERDEEERRAESSADAQLKQATEDYHVQISDVNIVEQTQEEIEANERLEKAIKEGEAANQQAEAEQDVLKARNLEQENAENRIELKYRRDRNDNYFRPKAIGNQPVGSEFEFVESYQQPDSSKPNVQLYVKLPYFNAIFWTLAFFLVYISVSSLLFVRTLGRELFLESRPFTLEVFGLYSVYDYVGRVTTIGLTYVTDLITCFVLIVPTLAYFMSKHRMVKLNPENLRFKFTLVKCGEVSATNRDKRGVNAVTDLYTPICPAPLCTERRWIIRSELQTDLSYSLFSSQIWNTVQWELYERDTLTKQSQLYSQEYSYRQSVQQIIEDRQAIANDALVNGVKREDTTLNFNYYESVVKHLPLIRRFDMINWDGTDANYEHSNALVSAGLVRYLSDVVLHTTHPFQQGVPKTRISYRTYDATYCYGYVVNAFGTPLKDLIKVGLAESRDFFSKIVLFEKKATKWILHVAEKTPDFWDNKIKPFAKITFTFPTVLQKARKMMRRLPLYVSNCVPPMPDVTNCFNKLQGALKRLCRIGGKIPTPHMTRAQRHRFRSFVRSFLKHNYKPLTATTDVSFETWLSSCNNYNEQRKEELRKEYAAMVEEGKADPKRRVAKFFLKTENYALYKYPRLINAMCDYIKIKLGPAAKQMEHIVYSNEADCPIKFIKHVPVRQRANYIENMIRSIVAKLLGSDYTSFECSFDAPFMDMCELELYRHFLKYMPRVLAEFELLLSWNICISEFIKFKIKCRRMSGEMVTSLGNGFTNMMLVLWCAHEQKVTIYGGVVEGDDGLFITDKMLDLSATESLGFECKEVRGERVGDIGFCQMYYDDKDMVQITDIRDKMARIGWTSSSSSLHAGERRMKELLRAKAASLIYEVPGCPVLTELAMTILKLTSDCQMKFEDDPWWTAQVLAGVSDPNTLSADVMQRVTDLRSGKLFATRELVARTQGISVELQLRIENYLRNITTLGSLEGPILELYDESIPEVKAAKDYYERHVEVCPRGAPWAS